MARFVPPISVVEIKNDGERVVAEALESQLPDSCLAFHSYPWLNEERADKGSKLFLREGEADFAVILPEAGGFLVLEVKEGKIVYDPAADTWYRTLDDESLAEIHNPVTQAHDNMHYFERKIVEESYPYLKTPPFAFGYAVVFPDCEYAGPPPKGADNSIILGAGDLDRFGTLLQNLVRKWSRCAKAQKLGETELNAIRRALVPSFQLMPALSRVVQDEERALVRMTEEQLRLLDFLEGRQRAAIQGVAGSGKTLMALAQAQRFAQAGRRTLLMCYNKNLSAWLAEQIPAEYRERVTVGHFHDLAARWCKEAKIGFPVPETDWQAGQVFWRKTAPELLVDAAGKLGIAFDAVVVDEGQDFEEDWWDAIEMLFATGSQDALFIFYDPAQNLFVERGVRLPVDEQPFPLKVNCRNTAMIARYCGGVIGKEIPVRETAPVGQECIRRSVADSDGQKRVCGEIVREWVKKGRLRPSQVAILGPRKFEKSALGTSTAVGGQKIVGQIGDWRRNGGLLYSTIRGFKGLEADAVILLDVQDAGRTKYFTQSDLYVAGSRAKHLLALMRVEG